MITNRQTEPLRLPRVRRKRRRGSDSLGVRRELRRGAGEHKTKAESCPRQDALSVFTLRSAYIRLFCPAVVSHIEVALRTNSAGSHAKNAIKIHPLSGWYFIFGHSPNGYWQCTSAFWVGLPAMQLLLTTHKYKLIYGIIQHDCRYKDNQSVICKTPPSIAVCDDWRRVLLYVLFVIKY